MPHVPSPALSSTSEGSASSAGFKHLITHTESDAEAILSLPASRRTPSQPATSRSLPYTNPFLARNPLLQSHCSEPSLGGGAADTTRHTTAMPADSQEDQDQHAEWWAVPEPPSSTRVQGFEERLNAVLHEFVRHSVLSADENVQDDENSTENVNIRRALGSTAGMQAALRDALRRHSTRLEGLNEEWRVAMHQVVDLEDSIRREAARVSRLFETYKQIELGLQEEKE